MNKTRNLGGVLPRPQGLAGIEASPKPTTKERVRKFRAKLKNCKKYYVEPDIVERFNLRLI